MHGTLMFGAGVGLGYVLGTRAGRERFDEIRGKAKHAWESKPVQDAAGAVQERAGRMYEGGKQMMSERTHKVSEQTQAQNVQPPSDASVRT